MNARNAKYLNTEMTAIDLEYEHPVHGWIPFTATADDVEQLGQDLFNAAIAGDFGPITAYVAPTAQELLDTARSTASLTRMEFMLALDTELLLDTIETAMTDPATPTRIKIMWNNASSFERMHPDLLTMATNLGITDTQMDSVFGII
jgi:hypothetical protein